MFKKLLITICFLCVSIQVVFSEELFRILEDTPAWIINTFNKTNSNMTIIIPKGTILSDISKTYSGKINDNYFYLYRVSYEDTSYNIAVNTLLPINTEEIFNNSFLTNADPQEKIWVNSYFLEVLNEGDRNILIQHEQGWVDSWKNNEYVEWYESSDIGMSLIITQGTIDIGGFVQDNFWIRRIESIPNGYHVEVTWNNKYEYYYDPIQRSKKVNLPSKETAPVFDLYFIIDNDYMDVYYSIGSGSSNRVFCTTFVHIDAEIRRQIDGIIRYNSLSERPIPFEPQKITYWPRRADGSMDYPHHPLTVPGNSSAVFKFDDTVVKIEPVEENITHNENKNVIIQENAEKSSLPLPLLLAIIGGAVVAAGVVVVVVLRKKK